MKSCFFILILFGTYVSFSQKKIKSTEPYKTKSGCEFKVGDKLLFNEPYGFQEKYVSSPEKSAFKNFTAVTGEQVRYDSRYSADEIRFFFLNPDGTGSAALGSAILRYLVDLEKAVELEEIANCSPKLTQIWLGNENYLTNDIAYIFYASMLPNISNDISKEFLFLFRRKFFDKIREDEFEFQKGIKLSQNQIKFKIDSLEKSTVFNIAFEDVLGNYDFDREGFPVRWENNGIQIYSSLFEHLTPEDINKQGVKLTDLRIKFQNVDKFNFLPVSSEKANLFIKSRKDSDGNVDRSVKMRINFRITGLLDGQIGQEKSCLLMRNI